MKRALVLSGGGSMGAFEVGAVDYLVHKAGYDFNVLMGTSVGALNTAFLGQAWSYQELLKATGDLKNFWLQIKGDTSIYQKSILGYLKLLFRDALYEPKGLKALLKAQVDPERICRNPKRIVKVATVAMETGELLYADNRDPRYRPEFLNYVLASASMPLFFPGAPIDGKHWYDGGLRDITPLGAVFQESPDEIVIIITFPIGPDLSPRLPQVKPKGAIGALLRTIDILTGEIEANDLQLARMINDKAEYFPECRKIPLRIIAPVAPLESNGPLDFNPQKIRHNMEQGYEAARDSRLIIPSNRNAVGRSR